ncbi:hypothetical protein RN001_009810 [Aquatica leii]|uniref:RNA polymerase II subunit B1 CTD phosphatase RPAP2 homolog n=1 Tax=Aquatica leii TaxID=1421715 RepID=A0AAN7SFT5_9COLE|nr:hypothetical protein RN001_009810 [Aquatica leii]
MIDSLEDYIHFISDAPQAQPKTNTSKESVLLTLQKKKECEARAMRTVEFLIEGKIRSEVFFRCLNHLNRAYYSDIVEERSITKLCGYCLCDNNIPTMSKKRFAIDSKNNKVYDVINRKKYCSDYCYKASIHLEQQIDDSPLWLRNPKDFPKYTLLPPTDRGIPGDDLGTDLSVQKDEIQFESAYSFAEVSLHELTEKKSDQPEQTPKVDISVKENLDKPIIEKDLKISKDTVMQKSIDKKIKKDTKVKRKNKIQLLKKYVLEWLTLETYMFLFGEERIKDSITQLDLKEASEVTLHQHKELVQLCKRLNLSDCTNDKIERILDKQLKPLPSYNQIKKDNKNINVKVRSFYSGSSFEVAEKKTSKLNSDNEPNQVPTDVLPEVVPIGDPPNVIRQNIFLSNIKNAMKILTENLGLSWILVLMELETLVKTFALQPHTVVFQPVEWNLISLILIRMLGFHNATIKEELSSTKCQAFINASVSSFPGIQSMLNELFTNIEDINTFFNRYFHTKDSTSQNGK